MKLRYLILDDEPLAHNIILEYAKDVKYLELVAQEYSPTKALITLKENAIDLMFLDIKMPKLNGLDMLRLVDDSPEVIVTSAYSEYALESYDLKVCDYLLKPFRLDRFIQATEKAVANHKVKLNITQEDNDKLFVKVDRRFVQIAIDEIQYLESYGNYVKIWTVDKCHVTPGTLSSYEDSLAASTFFKIHKSFLVNKENIDFLEGNMLKMKNGNQISISKNYKRTFLSFMTKS